MNYYCISIYSSCHRLPFSHSIVIASFDRCEYKTCHECLVILTSVAARELRFAARIACTLQVKCNLHCNTISALENMTIPARIVLTAGRPGIFFIYDHTISRGRWRTLDISPKVSSKNVRPISSQSVIETTDQKRLKTYILWLVWKSWKLFWVHASHRLAICSKARMQQCEPPCMMRGGERALWPGTGYIWGVSLIKRVALSAARCTRGRKASEGDRCLTVDKRPTTYTRASA